MTEMSTRILRSQDIETHDTLWATVWKHIYETSIQAVFNFKGF